MATLVQNQSVTPGPETFPLSQAAFVGQSGTRSDAETPRLPSSASCVSLSALLPLRPAVMQSALGRGGEPAPRLCRLAERLAQGTRPGG